MIFVFDLYQLKNISFIPGTSDVFNGVSTDSRTLKTGEIFVALRGELHDGHEHLAEVIKKGAEAVIVDEQGFKKYQKILKKVAIVVVKNTRLALGELAKIYRQKFQIPIVAIGGSNGKTTTKDLLAHLLSQKYQVLKTPLNHNNEIGVPQTLFQMDSSTQLVVLELGTNHFGELKNLVELAEPTHVLLTNIGREHLEFFKDLKGVAKAETEMFDWALRSKAKVFINEDDTFLKPWIKKFSKDKVVTFGLKAKAQATMTVTKFHENYQSEIKFKYQKNLFKATVPLFGQPGVQAALASLTVASHLGIESAKLSEALRSFKLESKGRVEILTSSWGTLINDTYNSNPESVLMSLQTLKEVKRKGKILLVLADMLELGKTAKLLHEEIGTKVKQLKYECLLTFGPLSGFTSKKAGALKINQHFTNKGKLSETLKSLIGPGDLVYIKGSRGMKMEEIVQDVLKLKLTQKLDKKNNSSKFKK